MRSASGYATALAGRSQDLEYPVQSPGRQSRMPVRHRGAGRYCARDADVNARCVDARLWAQGELGRGGLARRVEQLCERRRYGCDRTNRTDLDYDRLVGRQQLQVKVDRRATARYGIHVQDAIEAATKGHIATQVLEGERR